METSHPSRGSALIIVMVLIIILLAGAGMLIEVSRARSVQTTEHRQLTEARLLAEMAIGMKTHHMSTTRDTNAWATLTVSGTASTGLWRGEATADDPKDPWRGTWTLRGYGRAGKDTVRAVQAKIRKENVEMIRSASALQLRGVTSVPQVNFSGNAFGVQGADTNINGTKGPGGVLPGIEVETDAQAAAIGAALTGKLADNVEGSGGSPSVVNGSGTFPTTAEEILAFAEDMTLLAQIGQGGTAYYSDPGNLSGNLTLGTATNPQITVIDNVDALDIRGTVTGAGILIIKDSDGLSFGGNFEFNGLVIVIGSEVALGGAGNPQINGSVIALGTEASPDSVPEIDLRGNIQLNFSTQGLALGEVALLNALNWEILVFFEVDPTQEVVKEMANP